MNRHRRHHRTAVTCLAAAAVLAVAGCGGSSPAATPSTTTTAAAAPAGAVTYADPSGDYTIAVSPKWKQGSSASPRVWFLSSEQRSFNDNVNVLVEKLPDGISLSDYIEASKKNAPQFIQNITWKTEENITVTSGATATRLRYSGSTSGVTAEFLQIITVVEGKRAVVVTLTGMADRMDADIAQAEPYMRTIDPLG